MSTPAVQVPATLSVDETIRATVRALRSARQVDVPPLARHIGVSRGSFYNRLNGAAPFLAAEIAGLAQFFGVPITDFYEGVVRVGHAPVPSGTNGSYFPGERHLVAVEPLVTVTDPSDVPTSVACNQDPGPRRTGVTRRPSLARLNDVSTAA